MTALQRFLFGSDPHKTDEGLSHFRQGYSRTDNKMDKSCEKEEEHESFEFLANGQMTFEPGLG